MKLSLYGFAYLYFILYRRHLQFPIKNCLPIHILEPRMLLYRLRIFSTSQSFLRILTQQLFNQISECFRRVFGEPYHSSPDQIIQLSFGISVERRETSIQLIQYNPKLIPVSHAVMSLFIDDLKRKIRWSPTKRFVDLIQILQSLAQPEICYQGMSLFVQNDVLGFEVAIENLVFVKGVYSQQNLAGVVSDVFLLKFLAFLEQFGEIPTLTVVHYKKQIGLSLESVPKFDDKGMINQRQDLLLGLYILVKTSPKDSLLSNGLQSIEPLFALAFDQIDLPECPLSYPFVELEVRQSYGLDFVMFLYELVQLEDILSSCAHFLLLLLIFAGHFLAFLRHLRHSQNRQIEHSLNHVSMVSTVSIQRIKLSLHRLEVVRAEKVCQTQVIVGQVHRSHSVIVLYLIRCSMQNQSLNYLFVSQLRSIMKRRIQIVIPLIKTNPSTQQQHTILQLIGLGGDMERSLPEISQSIDIDFGVIDQSAEYLDRTVHGSKVQGSPIGLVPVVDIDGDIEFLAVQNVGEIFGLTLDDGLQEGLMEFVELFPVVLPEGLQDASFLFLPQLRSHGVVVNFLEFAHTGAPAAIDFFEDILNMRVLERTLRVATLQHQQRFVGMLGGKLLKVGHSPAVNYLASSPVDDYVLAFLLVVLGLDERVHIQVA